MKLSFYARGDHLVTVPGVSPQGDQHLPRVGRVGGGDPIGIAAPPNRRDGKPTQGRSLPPASESPFVVEADSDAGRRLVKLTRRDASLWPADEETAAACGVAFVDLDFNDGEWLPVSATPGPNHEAE